MTDAVLLTNTTNFAAGWAGITVPSDRSITVSATSGSGQATITFTDGSTGGSPIVDRAVYASLTSGGQASTLHLGMTQGNTIVVSGLTPEATYCFTGKEYDAAGPGAMLAQVTQAV